MGLKETGLYSLVEKHAKWVGLVLVGIALLISISSRYAEFQKNIGAPNLEASYHVLLTIGAFNSESVGHHHFLPTITYGGEFNKGIPLASNIPTETGDYIYTSFPSLGFFVPYAFFKVFGLDPSLFSLMFFNFLLGILSTVLLYLLAWELLAYMKVEGLNAAGSAALASLCSVFSFEALLSTGNVYWAQCLYQVVFIASLLCLFRHLRSTEGRSSSHDLTLFYGLVFIGPLIEWTSFIFNIGVMLVFWLGRKEDSLSFSIAVKTLVLTFFSGIALIIHFASLIDLSHVWEMLSGRYALRGATNGSLNHLFSNYVFSYGLFLLAFIAAILFLLFTEMKDRKLNRVFKVILILSMFLLLENLIMLQHAIEFSFDRLKFAVPLLLVLAFALSHINLSKRIVLSLLLIGASFHGHATYKETKSAYQAWHQVDLRNRSLVEKIRESVDVECALFATNLPVRGYIASLFERNIYEQVKKKDLSSLTWGKKACGLVYLQAQPAFVDLPQIVRVNIVDREGKQFALVP